jgi:carbonic anhydrase
LKNFVNFSLYLVILETPLFFRREIQIHTEIIFPAMNFKKIKDDYREVFAKISEKCKVEFLILTFHEQTTWLYFVLSTFYFKYKVVQWIVNRVPVPIRSEDMRRFRNLRDDSQKLITSNFRPVQPLNNRRISRNC